jgi:isopenicillin N synthase-like dioxygenase
MDESHTAQLETLSFANLANRDQSELTKLLNACQNQGFFYLDVRGSSASNGLEDRLRALSSTKKWFDSPTEEKMKFHQDSVTKGYDDQVQAALALGSANHTTAINHLEP